MAPLASISFGLNLLHLLKFQNAAHLPNASHSQGPEIQDPFGTIVGTVFDRIGDLGAHLGPIRTVRPKKVQTSSPHLLKTEPLRHLWGPSGALLGQPGGHLDHHSEV